MPRPVRRQTAPHRHESRGRRRTTPERGADRHLARLGALARSSPHPMIEFDRSGRITCHNHAARTIVEAFGQTERQAQLQEELAGIVSRCIARRCVENQLRTTVAGRTYVWTIVPLPAQGVAHAFPVDVTREEELLSRARHTDQLRSLGRLAGGMARGLNNHLTAIGFAGSALMKALPEDSPLRARVDDIRHAAEQASSVTNRLATFGRPREPRPRLVNPSAILEELSALLRPLLPPRLELSVRVGAPMARLWADPLEIRQGLLSLILDARDAIPGEGRIRIEVSTVRLAARGSLRHIGLPPGRYVALAVVDSDGAPPSHARASRVTALQPIVRQRGGDVWLRSTPGVETRCTIYLPLAPRRGRAVRPRETVLLVEADPRLRDGAAGTLREAGYRVLTASSATAAARMAVKRRRRIHLLMADLATCGGTDLIGPVREAHPDLKVLFLAGAAVPATDLPILEKPFTPDRLAAAVRDALDLSWVPESPAS